MGDREVGHLLSLDRGGDGQDRLLGALVTGRGAGLAEVLLAMAVRSRGGYDGTSRPLAQPPAGSRRRCQPRHPRGNTGRYVGGFRLQLFGLSGLQPLIGGRLYGVGTVALGVQLCATIFLVAAMAGYAARAGAQVAAVTLVSVVGALVMAVDVAPMWGAKVGAVPVLVPALAYLAMRLLAVRVTIRGALLVVASSAVNLTVACTLDYLRPVASRGHLGPFVASLLNGQAGVIIARKASQDLELLATAPLAFLMPVGLLFVVVFASHTRALARRCPSCGLPTGP